MTPGTREQLSLDKARVEDTVDGVTKDKSNEEGDGGAAGTETNSGQRRSKNPIAANVRRKSAPTFRRRRR
ncbi:unnamed protein product [Sphagnum jensenii]